MTTKFFKPLFIALSLTAFSFGLKAQNTYEYATVKCLPKGFIGGEAIYVSISGKEQEKISVPGVKQMDDTPLLNYVAEMTKSGWKVVNTISHVASGGQITIPVFVLERKKQ